MIWKRVNIDLNTSPNCSCTTGSFLKTSSFPIISVKAMAKTYNVPEMMTYVQSNVEMDPMRPRTSSH